MRVIQIGIDIAVDDSADIESIKNQIANAIKHHEVMGIEQSDYSWDYDEYIRGNVCDACPLCFHSERHPCPNAI